MSVANYQPVGGSNLMGSRLIIVSVSIFVAAIAVVPSGCKRAAAPIAPPLPEVVITDVVQRDVPVYSESVGTTEGFVNADIYPKITGYLLKQNYGDGDRVRAGQLLFQIDDREYKAALDQALGDLGQKQADYKKNRQDLDKYTPLYQQQVISKQDFDHITQTTRASAAAVASAEAAVETAKLNEQWTQVTSPIDGIAGIAKAQVGDLVSPTMQLATVSQLDPIKVEFPVSEKTYLHFADQINQDPLGKNAPKLEMILSDGSTYKYPGHISNVNRQVEIQTGTIEVQGIFPNPGHVLRPGMYAKVRAAAEVRHKALLVPQEAVLETQGQYQVAIVGSDDKVTMRTVVVGQQAGGLQIIEKGVSPGERVITEGLQKVSDGMEVKLQSVRPEPALAESPTSGDQAPSDAATPGSRS
jgi:membrane fusion protein (multidrug efflux system)